MTQSDLLFQQIMERPDDDGLRLMYADRLEQDGHRDRAEFIRVQIALNSAALQPDQRSQLEERERELLRRSAWDWAAEFGQDVSEWKFERGFIARIETTLETTADKIVNVFNRGPVVHLRDSGQFCDLRGFVEALPKLSRLTGLECRGPG